MFLRESLGWNIKERESDSCVLDSPPTSIFIFPTNRGGNRTCAPYLYSLPTALRRYNLKPLPVRRIWTP